MPLADPLLYLFGIARAGKQLKSLEAAKSIGPVEFAPPRNIASGNLQAVVCDLHMPEGVELDTVLQDPSQAEAVVLYHHRVLEWAADQLAILPLRLGAVFSNERCLQQVLKEGHAQLQQAIEKIEGAAEWGVKVYCDRTQLRKNGCIDSAETASFRAKHECASDGKKFFLLRQLQKLIEKDEAEAITQCLNDALTQITPFAKQRITGKFHANAPTESMAEMVSNDAFLIEFEHEKGFHEAVEKLNAGYGSSGFLFHVTGPWPSYSFATVNLIGDENAL